MRRHAISVGLGTLSVIVAWLAPIGYLAYAGLLFFLMAPAPGAFGYFNGRARERLEARLCEHSGTRPPVATSAAASLD